MRRGRVLDHGAVRRERAAEDREAGLGRQRVRARPDDVVVEDLGARQRLATATARRRSGRRGGPGGTSAPRRPPASKKSCIRYLPDGRRLASTGTRPGELVEAVQRQRDAGSAGHRDQVDDRVGRAAQREHDRDRVLEVLRRQRQRRQRRRSAAPRRPPCADGPNARPGSKRRPAKPRPSASTADVIVDAVPIVMQCPGDDAIACSTSSQSACGDVPGAQLGPVLPDVGPAAQRLAAPVRAQHRPARHEDERQTRGHRAHDQRRRRLVAPAQQHRAVERIRAQQLLASPSRAGSGRASSRASGTARSTRSPAPPTETRPPARRRA